MPLDDVHDAPGQLTLDDREGQSADREDLIRAEAVVVDTDLVIDVDDVEQEPALVVPEALYERGLCVRRERGPSSRPTPRDAQRVDPQRLHFDRLANARRHDPIADLRIHPRELHTLL